MKNSIFTTLLSIILCAAMLIMPQALAHQVDDEAAAGIVSAIIQDDFEYIEGRMSQELAELLPAGAIRSALEEIFAIYGLPVEIVSVNSQDQHAFTVVCAHELANLIYSISFDEDEQLTGIFVSIAKEQTDQQNLNPNEEEIVLREGLADETRGKLTLPEGDGVFPVVILVHGSGPQDMDQTIYENKPFRDIAQGLAARGIAVIRYDKYTYSNYSILSDEQKARFSIYEEYINDVSAALEYISGDARLGNVILAGHSLGGMLMPRIINSAGVENFAGGISLAGTPLDLWEIQYYQNLDVLEGLSGEEKDAARGMIEIELDKLDGLQDMDEDEKYTQTFFGLPVFYQLDIMSVDAADMAVENALPVLFIQGDADWQVKPEWGIEEWQHRLAGYNAAEFKLYENINHLLMPQTGDATHTLQDYAQPGAVADEILDDMAEWINTIE